MSRYEVENAGETKAKSQSVLHTYPEGGVFRHVLVGVEVEALICPVVVSLLDVDPVEGNVFEVDCPRPEFLPVKEE